jgi:hypothetical protein
MVFNIHGNGVVGVEHGRAFHRERPWHMDLQLPILLERV